MRVILASVTAALVAGAAGAAPFTNGSFETLTDPAAYPAAGTFNTPGTGSTVISGWTVTGGNVDYIDNGFWQASNGQYSLDMDGLTAGTIAQTFDTVAGQGYTVTFDLSKNYLAGSATLNVSAGAASQDYTFSAANSAGNMLWSSQTFKFIASGSQTTLSFASLTDGAMGPALDNVQVSSGVPEPASWAMMIGGFGLVGASMRRKKATASFA